MDSPSIAVAASVPCAWSHGFAQRRLPCSMSSEQGSPCCCRRLTWSLLAEHAGLSAEVGAKQRTRLESDAAQAREGEHAGGLPGDQQRSGQQRQRQGAVVEQEPRGGQPRRAGRGLDHYQVQGGQEVIADHCHVAPQVEREVRQGRDNGPCTHWQMIKYMLGRAATAFVGGTSRLVTSRVSGSWP